MGYLSPSPFLSQSLVTAIPSPPALPAHLWGGVGHLQQKGSNQCRLSLQGPFLQLGPLKGKLIPTSLRDPCPRCQPTQGEREALGMSWAQWKKKKKKEKRFISQWGNKLGAGCFLEAAWSPPDAHPPSKMQGWGGPPSPSPQLHLHKRRGPRLPLAGLPLPQHRDSLAGQERQLNAVKIASQHVLQTLRPQTGSGSAVV